MRDRRSGAGSEGWIEPQVRRHQRTGKTVAVVGSGPAGLACAQQLARAGHSVTIFEKSDRMGGLLRYGIPDFKMEKAPDQPAAWCRWMAEGVQFRTSVEDRRDHVDGLAASENFDIDGARPAAPKNRARC